MADNTLVERIIDSLAFEVEALPQEDVLEISDTSKATPLNLKIRVRKKDQALFEQGVVSVPKLGHPKKPPEQIRLVNSDHTVLSFKVFVDTQPDKKSGKKRKRFFGGCLSSEDNDDDPYVDSNPETTSKSDDITKQNFGLSKTEIQDMQLQPHKPVMFLGNRCKPGGCLDPALDEDKYSYEPKDYYERKVYVKEHSKIKNEEQSSLTDQKNKIEKTALESVLKQAVLTLVDYETNKNEIEPDNKSVQSIYQSDFIMSSLDTQYSDSIITYPPNDIADNINDKLSSPKRTSDETRKSFPEFRDSYFIPPKSATNNKNNSDADKQKVENYLSDRHTEACLLSEDNKGISSIVKPVENTTSNIKSNSDPSLIFDIDNKKSKTSILSEETKNSNLGTNANELQSKKDMKQAKEENIVTALKSEAVLATPLLMAGAAMTKIQSDKDNDNIHSEHENSNNDVGFESINEKNIEKDGVYCLEKNESVYISSDKELSKIFVPSSCDLHQKKEKDKSYKDENAMKSEGEESTVHIVCDENKDIKMIEATKQHESSKDINITERDIALSETKNSQDYLRAQDYTIPAKKTDILTIFQSTDQYLEKLSNNGDYFNKVETDKGSQVVNHTEENKDIVSHTSSLMEVFKRMGEINKDKKKSASNNNMESGKSSPVRDHIEANTGKVSLTSNHMPESSDSVSDNVSNIKEQQQHDFLGKEQSGFLNKSIKATEEEKQLFGTDIVVDQEDFNKSGSLFVSSMSYMETENDIQITFQHNEARNDNIQHEEQNQNSKKYQDAMQNLSDNTFDVTQNIDPFDNNIPVNDNKNSQIGIERMLQYRDYQQITPACDNEFGKVDDSVHVSILQKQNLSKDHTLEPVYHQMIDLHQDKDSTTEEEKLTPYIEESYENNKTSENCDNYYKQPIDTMRVPVFQKQDEYKRFINEPNNDQISTLHQDYGGNNKEKEIKSRYEILQDYSENMNQIFENYDNNFKQTKDNVPISVFHKEYIGIDENIKSFEMLLDNNENDGERSNNRMQKEDIDGNIKKLTIKPSLKSLLENNADINKTSEKYDDNYKKINDTVPLNIFQKRENNTLEPSPYKDITSNQVKAGNIKGEIMKPSSRTSLNIDENIKETFKKYNDKRKMSIMQNEDVDKPDISERNRHHIVTSHQQKVGNIEEENIKPRFKNLYNSNENIFKISNKYDEYYERTTPVYKNFVNMDIAFQSYTNHQNESVIKTMDTVADIKRRPQDKVTIIKSQVQLNTPRYIKIPIENHMNMILEVKASHYQEASSSNIDRTTGSDMRRSDSDENTGKELESFQNLLSVIYEEQLLPLQSLISDLKKDVDVLVNQQMWLKENWSKSKKAKTIRVSHSNIKCVCYKK